VPIPEIPEAFNAASVFIDRQLVEGHGERPALRWQDKIVTYRELAENVNRAGNAFLRLGVRPEERVLLAVFDSPEFVYSFWGAVKIGAVPVPVNTFLRQDEYAYMLENSRASVFVASQDVWPTLASASPSRVRQQIVVGESNSGTLSLENLLKNESTELEPEPTHRDDMALWLYSSGSTGAPKGVVHLHRNLLYCSATYAREVLDLGPDDVTFPPRAYSSRTASEEECTLLCTRAGLPCLSPNGLRRRVCLPQFIGTDRPSFSACLRCTRLCCK